MDRETLAPADVADWYDATSDLLGPRPWALILATEAARCRRYGSTASVVVVETPALDEVAADLGPDVRAVALARVGRILRSVARSSDYVARVGPQRFAVLLPETDEVAAVNFVERARARCDGALAGTTSERCRFGWADARPSRPLDVAAELAVSRLASDR